MSDPGDPHFQFSLAELQALAQMPESEWEEMAGAFGNLGLQITMLPDWDAVAPIAVTRHGEALFRAVDTSGPGVVLTEAGIMEHEHHFLAWAERVTGARFRLVVDDDAADDPDSLFWSSHVERIHE